MTRTAHFGRKGPKADIRLDLFAAQKSPGKPDQYFATTGLPQLKR
jgi:hypothetical protein